MAKEQEIEYRNPDLTLMTREQKQDNLKRMLESAGVTETDIQTHMLEGLTEKELNDYYKEYDTIINKYKTKKV